jgi:transcriptional regulator with XRE-family HTH domain
LSLGKRLKELRNEKKLSQEALANNSGVTKSSISQMENDRLSPSINTLRKIAKALEVRITYFFEEEEKPDYIRIVRKDEHRVLTFDHTSERWQILASGIRDGRIVGIVSTLGPGDEGGESIMVEPGEMKLIYMLKGKAEFIYNDCTYDLAEGDSVYFDGGVPHNWRNTGRTEARALVILTK